METVWRFSDNSDETIKKHLDDSLFNRMKEFDSSKAKNYKLVMTGTVGSGKSTICECLACLFNSVGIWTNNFPEFLFVNDDISGLLLTKKINGRISNTTFQNFVLDNWESILKQNMSKPGLCLFERCVDDCVICFSNIDNANKSISDLELYTMYRRLQKIDADYDVPSYFDSKVHFTKIQSGNLVFNLHQILDIIKSDLKHGIYKRVIGLSVSDFDSKQRIKQRGRDGEDNYDDALIKKYNNHYKKLFETLEKGGYVSRFLDIGMLIN